MDRLELLMSFVNGTKVKLDRPGYPLVTGKISGIELEDGSGYSFMVSLYGHLNPYHVQCKR